MNKEKERKYINFHVKDFLASRGIPTDNLQEIHISMEQLNELSEIFLDFLFIGDRQFLGVDGWLQWIYGCLLERFYQSCKKYNGVKVSQVPELSELYRNIEDFKVFTEKYLGYKYVDGKFKFDDKNKEL